MLYTSTARQNAAVVQLLLDDGATAVTNSAVRVLCSTETAGCTLSTALMMCVTAETVRAPLAAGGDVHMTNDASGTYLYAAAVRGCVVPVMCF